MSTAPTLARSYEALRPKVLDRRLELRATLEPSLGRLDDATARAQIGAVLDHLGNFIATGDLGLHRGFLHTFLAMRAAEAQRPASVLREAQRHREHHGMGTTVVACLVVDPAHGDRGQRLELRPEPRVRLVRARR